MVQMYVLCSWETQSLPFLSSRNLFTEVTSSATVFKILHILLRNNSRTLVSQAFPAGSQDSGGQRSVLQSRIWEEGVLQEQGGTSYRLPSEQHQNLELSSEAQGCLTENLICPSPDPSPFLHCHCRLPDIVQVKFDLFPNPIALEVQDKERSFEPLDGLRKDC